MYVTAGKDIIALEPETAKVIWRYTAPAASAAAVWPTGPAIATRRRVCSPARAIVCSRSTPSAASRRRVRRRRYRLGRSQGEHPRRRRRRLQPDVAAGNLQEHRHHRRQQRRAVAELRALRRHPRLGRARPASCCGRSTPCRAPASRASRPGKATAGRTAPAPTSGRSSPSTSSAASSTRRSARRRPTTTAAIARARTSTATRSSRSTRRPAS